jgi:Domain of unknown function (DUF4383)
MEAASPARLYAAVVGAFLIVLGLLGFFYDASFGALDDYEDAVAGLQVNGWLNLFYIATGAVGLLAAGIAPRGYSLAMAVLFVALAVLGWGTETLHIVIGLLGLAAVAGTQKPKTGRNKRRSPKRGSKVAQETTKKPRKSKPRAKPAGKSA